MSSRWFSVLLLVLGLGAAFPLLARESPQLENSGIPADSLAGPFAEEADIKVPLPGAKDRVRVVRTRDGKVYFILRRLGAGTDRAVTPEEFSALVVESHAHGGPLFRLLNITSPAGMLWVGLGLAGQLLFTGRMLIQWIVSEKEQRSTIPIAFWWMSLIGATMLLVYFIWRRDIVGVLGQSLGWMVYLRNLALIYRSRTGQS